MATFPTSPGLRKAGLKPINLVGSVQSPFSGHIQRHDFESRQWEFSCETPPMKEGDANINAWVAFMVAVNGGKDTFTKDVSRYAPGQSGLTALTFTAHVDQESWEMDTQRMFRFRLTAISNPIAT